MVDMNGKVPELSKLITNDPEKLDNSLKENEKLGFILKKNPASGMIKRIMCDGELSAYYYKDHPGYYVMYFHDYTGSSFGNENTYLNPTQYTSPQSIINIIHELFQIQNKKMDIDPDMENINSLHIAMVRIDTIKSIKQLCNKFQDFNINFESVDAPVGNLSHYYSVSIKTFKSIHYLLNFTLMIFITISSLNSSGTYTVTDSVAKKLVGCINNINSPYFVRYLIASRILLRKDFYALKSDLEMYEGHKLVLHPGNTAEHRRNYIKSLLSFKNDIVDIGCGDGFYAIPYSKNLVESSYHAFDIDQEQLDKLKKKISKGNISNINVYESRDEFFDKLSTLNNADIIITEVVEHMGEDQSREFLIDVLSIVDKKANIVIITTPNFEFNVNYCSEAKFRHDDHKWEMTRDQFKDFMNDIITSCELSCDVEFVGIGDIVDDVPCTQGCILRFH